MKLTALALLIALAAPGIATAQDPGVAPLPSQALYEAPPIRPFEPTGDLGGEAEGDSSSTYRGPVRATVAIDEYRGQFEAGPTDAALAYDQGVTSAEQRMDQRMGPMDGAWQLVGEDGAVLMALVLSDPGSGLPIEGAWMSRVTPGAGTLTSGRRESDAVTLLLIAQGPAEGGTLELVRSGRGWTGTLQGERRRLTVSLVPRQD